MKVIEIPASSKENLKQLTSCRNKDINVVKGRNATVDNTSNYKLMFYKLG